MKKRISKLKQLCVLAKRMEDVPAQSRFVLGSLKRPEFDARMEAKKEENIPRMVPKLFLRNQTV